MKRWMAKLFALLLVATLSIPVINRSVSYTTAEAATVSLYSTRRTVIKGNTYTVGLRNSTLVSRTTWKSSNTKVATVNYKGLVTPVAAGTATITCTAYLKAGGSTTLQCYITVKNRIPATSVDLNAKLDDTFTNAQVIPMGSKYDFTTKKTPSYSTDSTYYVIRDPEIATVNIAGIVTPKKPGITVLEARIGLNKTEALSENNKVVKKLYIVVTKDSGASSVPTVTPTGTPTATPTPTPTLGAMNPKAEKVVMISSKEIQIQFNAELLKSSIIDNNGNLVSGTVIVTAAPNAKDIGVLTPVLSKDKKSLNLTASGEFDGTYIIGLFNKILTADNNIVAPGSFQVTLKDQTGPIYIGTDVSDNGNVCQIHFNEAIDISGLSVSTITSSLQAGLPYYLKSAGSYRLSEDKKSLVIDLGGYQTFATEVTFMGIKDLKGNSPAGYTIHALVRNDRDPKPAAVMLSAERTGKSVISAKFDRPIETPGYAMVEGNYLYGTVDSSDNKIVNYTIYNASMTGVKTVTFSGWRNYNMVTSATNTSVARQINMTLDTTPPKVVSAEMLSETTDSIVKQTLILTYDKKVIPTDTSGTINTSISSSNGNIYNKKIPYTAAGNEKVITLTLTGQSFESGNYTFTLPSGFVIDMLDNRSKDQVVKTVKSAGSSAQLPAPVLILQDLSNPSKIKISFNNKLDMASVMNITNYAINGSIRPESASLVEQDETHAVVELTFASGVITDSAKYAITVSGIKGYNDSYNAMKSYTTEIVLTENNIPQITSQKLTSNTTVTLTLSKNVSGTAKFRMLTAGATVDITNPYISGNTIMLNLPQSVNGSVIIMISENEIKDSNNNKAQLPGVIQVTQ